MIKFAIVVLLFGYGECGGGYTGSGGASVGSYGGSGSFGSSLGGGVSSGGSGLSSGPIQAAVESHRTLEVRPIQLSNEQAEPQLIEVESGDLPVNIHFKSHSSRVNVQQTHVPGVPPEVEHTSSEDEPHRVVHEVLKPVIQEVREVIQPYRRVIQQIQPVIEQTHTIVSKGEPRAGAQQLTGGGQAAYGSTGYASRQGVASSSLSSSASSGLGGISIRSGADAPRIKYADGSSAGYKSAAAAAKSARARA